MKHKQHNINNIKSNRSLVIVSIIAIVAVALITTMIYRNHSVASPSPKSEKNVSNQPLFSFNATKAPGWWQGATNATSMAVFDKNDTHACFVSAEYKKGTVNADAEINKVNTKLTQSGGYTVTPIAAQTLEIQTDSKPLQYELRQSSVVTPEGGEQVKGGQEFGFAQLADGYIKIMGYCDTPEQLPATLPALSAIKFDNTK